MTRFRKALIFSLIPLATTGCAARRGPDVGVPDAARRFTVQLASSEPARTADIDTAAVMAACLVRGGDVDNCQQNTPCNIKKTQPELAAELRPVLLVLKELDFSSPSAARLEVRRLFSGAAPTFEVADARRAHECNDWGALACLAVRYKDVWFLLGRGPTGNRVESIDIFLAKQACGANAPGEN